ncbi:DNA-binding response regulator [Devosia sp. CN2-171]|jgi:FixJ family two-component response regulator|uniref:DNA-binding response regulator n=1 Tax=Devosia sp. CN2-171 TaxID=3400909 RepID=UPI003BF9248D
MVHLLVVAPSSTFRNSLRFALEAEGYDVTAAASMHDVDQPSSSFACTVLDHHALDDAGSESRRILAEFEPVVFLANSPAHPMAALSFRTLTKPTLGPALSDAVRSAIATRTAT